MRGVKGIEKALRVFTKVRDNLIAAMNECSGEIADKQEQMSYIGEDISFLNEAYIKADKALKKINEIVG